MTRNFNDVWINYVIINWPKESYFEIVTPIQTMIPATSRSGRYELSWFIQMCGMYVYIYTYMVYIGLYWFIYVLYLFERELLKGVVCSFSKRIWIHKNNFENLWKEASFGDHQGQSAINCWSKTLCWATISFDVVHATLVGGFSPSAGLLFPMDGKIKNVPNHQPVLQNYLSSGNPSSPWKQSTSTGKKPTIL